tara:strand:- start:1546 stop:2175 length:630 start_codon:yes stop_codon:yes gene_type:complete
MGSTKIHKKKRVNKTKRVYKSNGSRKTKRVYKKKEYSSGDGMLTTVWGPSMWHYLHTMSFNYPVKPTTSDKKHYKNFILSMKNVLPCRHCRENLTRNFKAHPIRMCDMKNRETFSRYVYKLHEVVNKMLGKKSGLSYCDVRERYEHFRARCTLEKPKMFHFRKTQKKTKKEKGCTEPLYGKKSKCVIKIVPQDEKCKTMQIDKKCIKQK